MSIDKRIVQTNQPEDPRIMSVKEHCNCGLLTQPLSSIQEIRGSDTEWDCMALT